MSLERVQKILARAGVASRRKAEDLIREGLVTINGKIAQLGDQAEWGKDAIKVQGKLLFQALKPQNPVYIAFYKPRGVISTMEDSEGRECLSNYLSQIKARIFPVGKLDFTTEGLMLLTNDGDFAERFQKQDNVPRVYSVKVKGHPSPEMMKSLAKGAKVGEGRGRLVRPYSVRISSELQSKAVIEIAFLGGGPGVDIKGLLAVKGFLVDKIVRTSIGTVTLKGLEAGQYRFLKATQAQALLERPEVALMKIDKDVELSEKKRLEAEIRAQKRAEKRPGYQGEIKAGKKLDGKPKKIVPVKPLAKPAKKGQKKNFYR